MKMIRRMHLEDLKERIVAIEARLNKIELCEEASEQVLSNPIPESICLVVKRYIELPPSEREVLLNVICDNEEKKERIRSYAAIYQSHLIAGNLRKETDQLKQEIDLLIKDARNLKGAVNAQRADKPAPSSSTKGEKQLRGELIPNSILRETLLEVLTDMGGRGKARVILDEMESRLGSRLTYADRELLEDNEARWRKKAQWLRFALKQEGILKDDSPRGIWELSKN